MRIPTRDELIALSHRPVFNIGQYQIISQDPSVISDANRRLSATRFLPAFINAWMAIEKATGYRWKSTSYIRDSPSHSLGHSFDLAPDIAPSASKLYSVNNGSDPVLYKRAPLIRALQTLKDIDYGFHMGAFIEPDHIHLQVVPPNSGNAAPFFVAKWKVPKPIYSDTFERMELPLIEG